MVKIRNLFGDRYKGRQGGAVYQGRYGKQIRRTWNDRKKNRSPAQEEQKARFRQAHAWIKGLTSEEIEGLKRFTAEHYPGLTWQQYAIKTALDRGKVSVTTHEVSTLKEIWRSDWDAPGWPYREDITLTNNMAEDLTDYQKLLELDETKVGPNFRWDLGGKDLRFYDENGQKIPYWVESWDEENKTAKVWVKVPLILAQGQATIKMYYGNPSAASESDAENVFDFYDDFEGTALDTSKWTGSTDKVEVSDGVLHGTAPSEWYDIIHTQEGSVLNKIVESRVKVTSNYTKPAGPSDGTRRAYFSHEYNGDDRYQMFDGSNWPYKSSGNAINENNWDIYTIIVFGDGSCKYINSLGEALSTDFTSVKLQNTGTLEVRLSPGTSYFDWVRVRKYAEQEPAAAFGSEEYGKIMTGVVQVRTTVAVSHSGLHAVEVYDDQGNLLVRADGLSDLKSGEVTQIWEWHIDKDQAQPIGRVVYWSISGVKNEWTAGGT